MDTLAEIKQHHLLIRPSLTGNWRAGVFRGITGHAMPRAYCYEGTEWEAPTLEEAVEKCVLAIMCGEKNHEFDELINAGYPRD